MPSASLYFAILCGDFFVLAQVARARRSHKGLDVSFRSADVFGRQLAKWRSGGRIAPTLRLKGVRKIESLSSDLSQVHKLSISDFDDRAAMLLDVRARVSLMKRGLGEILRGVSTIRNNQQAC